MVKQYLFKVIIAGDGGVGKTTLLKRYITGRFHFNTLMTLGVEFHQKALNVGDKIQCRLVLWDLSGQTHFRFFLDRFVDGASGAILMFDLSRFITLLNLEDWIEIVRKYDPDIPLVLIGGKSDLVIDPLYDENKAVEFQEKHNISTYLKVSSLTGENVSESIEALTKIILETHTDIRFDSDY